MDTEGSKLWGLLCSLGLGEVDSCMKLFPIDQMHRAAEKGIRKQKPEPTQIILLSQRMAPCHIDEDTSSGLIKKAEVISVQMKSYRKVQEHQWHFDKSRNLKDSGNRDLKVCDVAMPNTQFCGCYVHISVSPVDCRVLQGGDLTIFLIYPQNIA